MVYINIFLHYNFDKKVNRVKKIFCLQKKNKPKIKSLIGKTK